MNDLQPWPSLLAAGAVALAMPLLPAHAVAGAPPQAMHVELERYAMHYRITVYNTFRLDRAQYNERIEAWTQLQSDWLAAGAPAEGTRMLLNWLREATRRSQPGRAAPLPRAPVFRASREPAAADLVPPQHDPPALQAEVVPPIDVPPPTPAPPEPLAAPEQVLPPTPARKRVALKPILPERVAAPSAPLAVPALVDPPPREAPSPAERLQLLRSGLATATASPRPAAPLEVETEAPPSATPAKTPSAAEPALPQPDVPQPPGPAIQTPPIIPTPPAEPSRVEVNEVELAARIAGYNRGVRELEKQLVMRQAWSLRELTDAVNDLLHLGELYRDAELYRPLLDPVQLPLVGEPIAWEPTRQRLRAQLLRSRKQLQAELAGDERNAWQLDVLDALLRQVEM